MPNLDNTTDQELFADRSDIYGEKIKPGVAPEANIGIDTKDTLVSNIVDCGVNATFDVSKVESFTTISQQRDRVYETLDQMCQDSTVAAALEIYAEDVTEPSADGRIVWAVSDDPDAAKYVNFLLDSLNVDKYIHSWATDLCKYGDIYLRMYRESDIDKFNNICRSKNIPQEDEQGEIAKQTGESNLLNEAVNLNLHSKNDHYINQVELIKNPAEVFELTKFGKTYGFIKTSIPTMQVNQNNIITNEYTLYKFNTNDVNIYGPGDFVHGSLSEQHTRAEEEVRLFNTVETEDGVKESDMDLSFKVKRGQSLFYDVFKIWREMSLLENSIILNRVTKSSIVRVIGVEVGDMPKSSINTHLLRVKQLIEQKVNLSQGNQLSESTNPGPVENNVYIATHGGVGAITATNIGGDVDIGPLTDLDYFKTKFYTALGVPKQFLGDTDDSTGFNGGTSLSIVSSRYAKKVKKLQNALISMLTDLVNLLLIDRKLTKYIGKVQLMMQAPITHEELDREANTSTRIGIVRDTMDLLVDVNDTSVKLKALKSMLSKAISNTEVIQLIQEEIEKLEEQSDAGNEEAADTGDMLDFGDDGSSSISPDEIFSRDELLDTNQDFAAEEPLDEPAEEVPAEATSIEDTSLPTPQQLGQDMTDNTQF